MAQEPELYPKMYLYKRIVEAKMFIDNNYAKSINLNDLAHEAAFSKFHFLRLFKSAFGISPHQYLIQVRLNNAKELLRKNDAVTEVCHAVGFESVPSFINLYKSKFGNSPKEDAKLHLKDQLKQAQNPRAYIPSCFSQQLGLDK